MVDVLGSDYVGKQAFRRQRCLDRCGGEAPRRLRVTVREDRKKAIVRPRTVFRRWAEAENYQRRRRRVFSNLTAYSATERARRPVTR